MRVKNAQTMGWTEKSVRATVLWIMSEQREQIAQRLTDLRQARRWTVDDLAHAAGVSPKTISRLQNAKGDPRRSTVRKIADALEVDPAEFLGPPPAAQATQLDRIESKLDQLLGGLA